MHVHSINYGLQLANYFLLRKKLNKTQPYFMSFHWKVFKRTVFRHHHCYNCLLQNLLYNRQNCNF